jgi:hypothetical protein
MSNAPFGAQNGVLAAPMPSGVEHGYESIVCSHTHGSSRR